MRPDVGAICITKITRGFRSCASFSELQSLRWPCRRCAPRSDATCANPDSDVKECSRVCCAFFRLVTCGRAAGSTRVKTGSYGIATLRRKHVTVKGDVIEFDFPGSQACASNGSFVTGKWPTLCARC